MNVADACLKKLELAGCPELRVLPWQNLSFNLRAL
jgi:hypothetical protein